jgi:hypothetical protein
MNVMRVDVRLHGKSPSVRWKARVFERSILKNTYAVASKMVPAAERGIMKCFYPCLDFIRGYVI